MRRCLLVFAVLCCAYALQAQKPMSIKIKDPIICHASTEDHPHYIPPPDEYLRRAAAGRRGPTGSNLVQSANIEVTYIGFGAVPEAQAAFERAIEIWESILISTVTIKVEARWVPLNPGVLGSANYTAAYANFKGAQRFDVFYPVAIAEKITGINLNGDDPDIFANFSSTFNWHFDPDDPDMDAGQYDLTTVVLHEIGHGLGFSGTFTSSSGTGSYGLFGTGVPIIYDSFIESGFGGNLLETVASPSVPLSAQLTSDFLFFNAASGSTKIYAPTTFNGGSSISHVDEATFNNTPNSLMTPQIASRERIRAPGIAGKMLNNLGWEMVFIQHNKLPDSESLNGPFTVSAKIVADNGYDPGSVTLNLWNGTTFTPTVMTAQGNDVFTANIPATGNARQYAYYISVESEEGAEFTSPGKRVRLGNPKQQLAHIFYTGEDTEDPIITHEKKLYVLSTESELVVEAVISDNIGSLNAVLKYSINGGAQTEKPLTLIAPQEDSVYRATINFSGLANGAEISYSIVATDNSSNNNQTQKDFTVTVVGITAPTATYQNTFGDPSRNDEFFGEGFSIATPAGFTNSAIHSEHPYINGSGFINNERELIYQLRVPIIVQATNALITFDEIALIEPSNSGAIFGGAGFYDYAIVEASDDDGETWQPLAAGYNCRFQGVWLTRYASAIDGDGNSTAVGSPELYRTHQFDMRQTFDGGTEVWIRFRMYIDELVVGWGWAIDNLAIQSVITATENDLEAGLTVYPNPTTENISVEINNSSASDFSIQLLTLQGQKVYEANEPATTGKVVHTIAAEHLATGMYLVKISNGSKSVVRKVIKRG